MFRKIDFFGNQVFRTIDFCIDRKLTHKVLRLPRGDMVPPSANIKI